MGDDRIKAAIREHRLILNSIEKSDTKGAIKHTKDHISNGMLYVVGSLQANESRLDYFREA
jgi:DNA-binding GntR family transcriptional regulator